jgi:hypothetical protein
LGAEEDIRAQEERSNISKLHKKELFYSLSSPNITQATKLMKRRWRGHMGEDNFV